MKLGSTKRHGMYRTISCLRRPGYKIVREKARLGILIGVVDWGVRRMLANTPSFVCTALELLGNRIHDCGKHS